MKTSQANTFLESVEGAALIAFHLLTPFLRSYRARWGAVNDELSRVLPGDELVAYPKWQYTHAITIAAPAPEVWGWLVQIGSGRGGLYSYDGLENLAGCNLHNSDQNLPEFQRLQAGDEIRIHPKAPGMNVAAVEAGHYILIHNDNRKTSVPNYIHTTWLLYLHAIDPTTTRLISRGRNDYSPELANKLWMGPLFVEPMGFVMERKMLLGIRETRRTSLDVTTRLGELKGNLMAQKITIDPVTRIEGHAKITIQLNDAGEVEDAHFHVTQLRGFEKFCEGRPFHEMPSLMARICGICPVSHLVASAKACDALLAVHIPPTAQEPASDSQSGADRPVARAELLLSVVARFAARHGC